MGKKGTSAGDTGSSELKFSPFSRPHPAALSSLPHSASPLQPAVPPTCRAFIGVDVASSPPYQNTQDTFLCIITTTEIFISCRTPSLVACTSSLFASRLLACNTGTLPSPSYYPARRPEKPTPTALPRFPALEKLVGTPFMIMGMWCLWLSLRLICDWFLFIRY
ncbi:hypothetical protein M405DRAFT_178088 [Rhizopogon salebrosus TDB-379]|nr:hypothetical protein M405DRAFT_178088 [Rhizopogon salebrosus TDB-379]